MRASILNAMKNWIEKELELERAKADFHKVMADLHRHISDL